MSSSRAHVRPNGQRNESAKRQPLAHSSRIPTRNSDSESSEQPQSVQHIAKMMKRTSRSAPTIEPTAKSGTKAPNTIAAHSARTNRRSSGTPPTFAPPAVRTPSLVSGSSVSTFDSPRPNGLRRKPSGAIDRYAAQRRAEVGTVERGRAAMHGGTTFSREDLDSTVLGITIPATSKSGQEGALDLAAYAYSSDTSRETTSSVPTYVSSATPSTRYSDSPFSPVPTPSSASSYSSSVAGRRVATRSPEISRHVVASGVTSKNSRLGLFPVRESSTSTSSSRSAARVDSKLPHNGKGMEKEGTTAPVSAATGKSTFRNRLTKARPDASSGKQKMQIPPELAHLNVDVPRVQPDVARPRAPTRPSRSGTSTLADMANPSSVVQSDLPSVYTMYHKRTPSQETPISASSPTRTRFGFSSRASSRTTSPRVDSAFSPPPSARRFQRSKTPDHSSGEVPTIRRKDSPAISASPAKSPRFGFFSRKTKPEVPKLVEKPSRQPSKGPSAGTGHEGYGRFGFRGRSGSNASSNGGRSPSADSSKSSVPVRPAASKRKSSTGSKDGSELDDFLKERLRPVILRGSGSTMSSDPIGASLEPESSKASSMEDYPRLLPSAMRKASDSSVETRQSTKLATSDSSGDESSRRVPSLATRRSITRLSSGENRSPVRVPPPINTNLHAKLPVIDSYDAEPTAWPQTDSSLPLTEDGREGLWLQPLDVKPSPKPARKWNFFSRAATTSPVKGKQQAVEDVEDAAMPPNRAIAHYAMSDNSHAIELDEVERIVQDDTDFEEDSMSDSESLPKEYPHGGRHLNRTPSPPNVEFGRDADFRVQYQAQRLRLNRQDSGETSKMLNAQSIFSGTQARPSGEAQLRPSVARAVHTPDMTGRRTPEPSQGYLSTPERANNSSRLPRLSPVGRIPPVVSRRDRDRKLPNTSFSRPFSSSQHRPFAKPPGSVYSQIREMASPTESNSQPVSSASTRSEGTMQDPISTAQTEIVSTDRDSVDLRGYGEFLAFPPRKGSDQSYSCSDSSSIPSWMTTLPPQKEDVWNEYNDFMDEVMPLRTPMRTPTTGSSLGAPFQYSSMLWDGNGNSWPIPTRTGLPPTQQLPPIPGVNTVPTILTVPQQISRFLRPSLSPITPDTISDLGNHISNFPPRFASLHNTQHPKRSSLTSARGSISSSRSSKTSTHSRSASLPSARNSQTDSSRMLQATSLAGIAEAPAVRNIKCSTDLRVGALMTSKWLSFGRVLFSPAHNEMQFADHPRILIVDGLSNDWSHFVALTYPDAQVYNIAQISGHSLSPIGATPPNLRQIRLPSFSASFPFPKDFFHTIVFRFPAATTEQTYAALLSECKRVLRPGGFLELAVLDLDLMNVGPKARRAVRGLKTRMQAKDSEVWLGNSSDLIVRGLGRRGFEGVKRFGVGVPVEGRIAAAVGQRERGGSSSSSGSSFAGISPSKELNLASLLDNTDFAMKSNDENITKMVARVGRWWYSSCYERILPVSDRSIWKDRTLLRECEEQGTSFRLFICQAQKPLLVRRRTKSV